MRGFAIQPNGEPVLNPSWQNSPKAKTPGWGMNGPGVSAEWTQGGESQWNSAAASSDETQATIYQDVEIPRAGAYKLWVRYADWANKTENFVVRINQGEREVLRHEFGEKGIVSPHDEVQLYWEWAFTWDSVAAALQKGPARISIEIQKAAGARRHVDCFLLTNDLTFVALGRTKPDFAAMRHLRDWSTKRTTLAPLLNTPPRSDAPAAWQRRAIAGRDFQMPWNIATEFWKLYDLPQAERPLYPFHAEPIEEFVKKYKGARDVPIFGSSLVVPVIYINNLPEYLKEGSPFLRYLRETKTPFAILINYGSAQFSNEEGPAAWKLLTGEFKDQFLGWISGESVGHVWYTASRKLKISPLMNRGHLLEAHRVAYNDAIAERWAGTFRVSTGAMWDKLIPAQSTSSTSFAHALTAWGVNLLGVETAAVQPMFGMRIAFTRGAARQYGGNFLYYHAPNFGDSATTFTKMQNFAGPDHFFHSRYGATMGPSLSWYRKSYYMYYMSGASAIYVEQGFDQYFKPGPGEHDFQLNPLGRITNEFIRFAEKHTDRGTPYTPIAFLLDPGHGWEMTDYPHWPFGISQINRSDRALRQLFGVAYYPGLVVEGEPASADRQAFVNGIFGNVFDVLVADPQQPRARVSGDASKPGPAGVNSPAGLAKVEKDEPAKKSTEQLDYLGSNPSAVPASTETATQTPSPSPTPLPSPPPHVLKPPVPILDTYRAVVVGGRMDWSAQWVKQISEYVKAGGTLVVNAAQIKGLPPELLGVTLTGAIGEADAARCLSPGEAAMDLTGQMFRFEKIELKGARALMTSDAGEPLGTVNEVGKGLVVFCALPDLLGQDERITPFAAHMLAHVFNDATPVKVRGDVEYLINRNASGWVVTLFNNNGVYKPQQGMPQVDRNAYVNVLLSIPGKKIQDAVDWISDEKLGVKNQNAEDTVTIRLAPGAVSIIALKTP